MASGVPAPAPGPTIELAGFDGSEHTWKVKICCDAKGIPVFFWQVDGPPAAERQGVPGPPHLVPIGKVGNAFIQGSDKMIKAFAPDLFSGSGVEETHDLIEGTLSKLVQWLIWVDPQGFNDHIVTQLKATVNSCIPTFIINRQLVEVRARRELQLKGYVGFPDYPANYDRKIINGKVEAFVAQMCEKLTASPTGWLCGTSDVTVADITLWVNMAKLVGEYALYKDLPQDQALKVWFGKMQARLPQFDPFCPILKKPMGKLTKTLVESWQAAGGTVELAGFDGSEHTWKVKICCDIQGITVNWWQVDSPLSAATQGVPGPPHLVPIGRVGRSFIQGSGEMIKAFAPDLFKGEGVQETHDLIEDNLSKLVAWLIWVDPQGFNDHVVARAIKSSCLPASIVRGQFGEVRQRRQLQLKDYVGFSDYPANYDRKVIESKIDAFFARMSEKLDESTTAWVCGTPDVTVADITLWVNMSTLIGAGALYKDLRQDEALKIWFGKIQSRIPQFDPFCPTLKCPKGKLTKKVVEGWRAGAPQGNRATE
jgi:hypothetical protein